MEMRRLGRNGPLVTRIGFGAFKIGRNVKTKYGQSYDLPSVESAESLLNGVLDMGVNYIDTAPAYGISEERIGQAIAHRRSEYTLSTKVGERFENGVSTYDFSADAIEQSIAESLRRLRTDVLDVVVLHSNGNDMHILTQTPAVETLTKFKDRGLVKAIGLSGKTIEGERLAFTWADVLMVEYHLNDQSHADVIADATARGIGIVVKKPLASGTLAAGEAIGFISANEHVATMIVGSLNLEHLRSNLASCAAG
jgi:aryl-alcohol dehydrogenase-like predicted oxidoreductase